MAARTWQGVCVGTVRDPPLLSGQVGISDCPSVRPSACVCVLRSHSVCV